MTKNALAHHPIKPRDDALHETHPFSFVAQRKSTSASTPYRQKAFSCDFMHPSLIPFRVPKRLAFKARVLLTFRTPLASNRLRHFFNAQATNNNNNNKRRSTRSFETEVTEENLASRASKSRESSRPKNEDDDVKKEKQIQSFFFFVPGRSEIHTRRERRKTTSKRRSSSRRSTFTTARSREHYYPRGGVVPSRFFGFGFSRRARVRAFSSRLLFSRRMMVQRETL